MMDPRTVATGALGIVLLTSGVVFLPSQARPIGLTWLVVIGLIGLLGAPLSSDTSMLLITTGLVVPTMVLGLSQKSFAMLAKVRHPARC